MMQHADNRTFWLISNICNCSFLQRNALFFDTPTNHDSSSLQRFASAVSLRYSSLVMHLISSLIVVKTIRTVAEGTLHV